MQKFTSAVTADMGPIFFSGASCGPGQLLLHRCLIASNECCLVDGQAKGIGVQLACQRDAFTEYLPDCTTLFSQPLPDGSTLFLPYVYERTAGGSGFLGTWDSESAKVTTGIELQIQPYESDGLSFKRSDEETVKRIKLDGNDYPDLDPNGGDKATAYSARRVNERNLEITEKSEGKTTGTRHIELSRDLKTLTVTVSLVGQSRPQNIFVYDRE